MYVISVISFLDRNFLQYIGKKQSQHRVTNRLDGFLENVRVCLSRKKIRFNFELTECSQFCQMKLNFQNNINSFVADMYYKCVFFRARDLMYIFVAYIMIPISFH